MRCMTAIWPAGPPKDNAATRSHTRVASPKEMPWAGRLLPAPFAVRSATPFSSVSRQRGVPIVLFVLAAATPSVKRVIHSETVLEHVMIVLEIGGEPER